jgi:hypothetical protein
VADAALPANRANGAGRAEDDSHAVPCNASPPEASAPKENALAQALDAARAQGLPARDPVRWRRIDALAQRTANHSGATRSLLDARLQALLAESALATLGQNAQTEHAEHAEHAEQALEITSLAPTADAPVAQTATRPLRALLAQLQSTSTADEAALDADARSTARDLKVVHQHRAAWTQLRAEQRVAQSRTALPDQAGPLNSQLLLHRALTLMRETAPGYLQHLMGQAEALMWLEQALATPVLATKTTSRGTATKASARGGRTAAEKTERTARR